MLLEGKARKAHEGIDVKALNADDGVYVLTNKLKELYDIYIYVYSIAFIEYQEFERYQRKQSVSISGYINQLKRLNDS